MRSHSPYLLALLALVACGDSSGPGITLDVTPDSLQLARNAQASLSVTALDEAGQPASGVVITFASSDTTIATVTSAGEVHSHLGLGRTIVRVSGGGHHIDVPVTVVAIPTGVTIAPVDTTLTGGVIVQYRASVLDEFGVPIEGLPVTWESTDTTAARISTGGVVISKFKDGATTINVRHGVLVAGTTLNVLDSLDFQRTTLAGSLYAAAISVNGVAYVADLGSTAHRANLPSHAFTSSVTVGSVPSGIAFNSTGSTAYVTNQYSSTVSVVSVASNTEVDVISVGNRPFEVIVAPGDSILYVAKQDSVYGIRLSTKGIIARFAIPDVGNGIAIARDTLLYVSTHNGGTVVEFNLRTRALGRTFTVGGTPQKLAVSPDGSELYIANEATSIQFWNLTTGTQIGSNLALPSAAYGLARRSASGLLYATSAYFGGGYVYVIDPLTRTLVHASVVGGSTRQVAFTADGSIGIVPNENGWVDFIK